ncbi:hypothetical protein L1887_14824 [Cichorium endivia]|nr:hypothetical protein L1887_14824 [Cichorium endivia]
MGMKIDEEFVPDRRNEVETDDEENEAEINEEFVLLLKNSHQPKPILRLHKIKIVSFERRREEADDWKHGHEIDF